MKTTLSAGLAMLTLGGCSAGQDEPWPPTVEQIRADLGTPPRGQAFVRSSAYQRGKIMQASVHWYDGNDCIRVVYIDNIGNFEVSNPTGGVSFSNLITCENIGYILGQGSTDIFLGENGGFAEVEAYELLNDSTIVGYVAGTVQGTGLGGLWRIWFAFSAPYQPLPER